MAVDDPTNWEAFRELQDFTGYDIQVVMATKSDVTDAQEKVFQKSGNNEIVSDITIEFYDEKIALNHKQRKQIN